ncbi:MAG TPA: hypothetical protein VGW38_06545 [Chloroflexota bacterium]|nr:hypothetical protein [Chloroflexota bacterium]
MTTDDRRLMTGPQVVEGSEPVSAPAADGASLVDGQAVRPVRRRRVSRTRQMFLTAIHVQITASRVLAAITFVVLLAAGFYWLTGTTGSPVIGIYFLVLALTLTVTVYCFIQLMNTFTGRR